jgi:hypothetical protein
MCLSAQKLFADRYCVVGVAARQPCQGRYGDFWQKQSDALEHDGRRWRLKTSTGDDLG